jgi:predicted small secreted protein
MMRTAIAKALLSLFILATAGTALSACHTARGVGEDVQSGGRAIDRAAD